MNSKTYSIFKIYDKYFTVLSWKACLAALHPETINHLKNGLQQDEMRMTLPINHYHVIFTGSYRTKNNRYNSTCQNEHPFINLLKY